MHVIYPEQGPCQCNALHRQCSKWSKILPPQLPSLAMAKQEHAFMSRVRPGR